MSVPSEASKPEVRSEVQWFAEYMERQLERNDHKGGWNHPTHHDDPASLLAHLKQETEELEEVLGGGSWWRSPERRQRIFCEAADVANFAMMIADVVHDWGERPREHACNSHDELLEACRSLIAYADERGYLGKPFEDVVDQVREVVAKAEGRSA